MDADFGRVAGATFVPAVAANGDISWANDGGLENPATVNIKGPPGAKGDKGDKGDDGTFSPEDLARISALESGKVDKIDGKGLSTNDYTQAEKAKLSGIAADATANAPATAAPLMDGAAAVGSSARYAREDHRHPPDISRAAAADVAKILDYLSNMEVYRTASGNPATFSDGKAANVKDLRVTIAPTQSGSGDPSPSNVRPISGVSSVTVKRTGKNLFKGEGFQSVTNNGITFTVRYNSSGALLDITANGTSSASAQIYLFSYSLYPQYSGMVLSGAPSGSGSALILQKGSSPYTTYAYDSGEGSVIDDIPAGASASLIWRFPSAGTVADNLICRPMIRRPGTDAAFEAYQEPQSVTRQLVDSNSNPLTVYGGTLDVTAGALSVTWANIASYNGETLPGRWISDRDVYAPGTSPTTGAQVVYELAAPATYQLTPAQLAALAGYNVVSSDAGTLSVTYLSDPEIALGGG